MLLGAVCPNRDAHRTVALGHEYTVQAVGLAIHSGCVGGPLALAIDVKGASQDGVEFAVDQLLQRQVRIEPPRLWCHQEGQHGNPHRNRSGARQYPEHHPPGSYAAGHQHHVLLLGMQPPEGDDERQVKGERRCHLHKLRHSQRHEQPQRLGGETSRRSFLQEADEPPAQTDHQEQRQHGHEDEQPFTAEITKSNAQRGASR